MSKALPVPVLGPLTLGAIAPTAVPNINAPSAPGVPQRRSHRDTVNIHPREYHSADFAAAPNTTAPAAPVASKRTLFDRRTPKSHSKKPASDLVLRKLHDDDAPSAAPGSPQAAAGTLANALKSVGAVPKQVSPVANAAPASVPDTPLTAADTSAAEAAAQNEAKHAPAPPVNEVEPVPGANPDAYPHADGYKYAAAPAPVKRHSLVLDTDPIVPPADTTGKDPSMGVFNLDSNQKPEDVPKENPEKDAKKVADETPAGDVPKNVEPAAGAPVDAAPVPEASTV
ncbi:hypothetical protein PHLGIDRAFT_114413 [Phlebiopsis gigantea 11061_1 CR5-6]|uniref:Uncharacterized protein n=1 Tax=Phlebiopsis gigantea (strain 11061_1 CR5-6) TaxID=745531 RepID=A0A0C3P184_PHLG1|nr:hypothetical protein PHLGIDRAFT_114413 [Phlebiopsis gigantea 11061_1 CR5-6]